jgi:lipoate-protein ligase A
MSYQKEIRFTAGSVLLAMDIKDGTIQNCKIYGDFFEVKPIEGLEQQFIGRRYVKSELDLFFHEIKISDYIHSLSNDEFKQLLFNN